MSTFYTHFMIRWHLKDTIEKYGITRYALQKESGVAMNTIRDMYDGRTQRPDLNVMNRIIQALEKLTGKSISVTDILDYEKEKGRYDHG